MRQIMVIVVALWMSGWMGVPVHAETIDLMGRQEQGRWVHISGGTWWFPDWALSTSTQRVVLPTCIRKALFTVDWIPRGNAVALVVFDDGPSNIQMAFLDAPWTGVSALPYATSPTHADFDVTQALTPWLGQDKHLGVQFSSADAWVYVFRVTLHFDAC